MRLSLKRVGHFHWDRVGSLKVVVAGDFRVLDADADCRFLMDILSAAPVGQEATA